MSFFKLKNTGDTILEVLIAIAVVSAVLGGAYVSANRSLNATRLAQERVEALKQVEAQLERLKAKAAIDPSTINISGTFCVDSDLSVLPSGCHINFGGGATYNISVNYDSGKHTVTASWDRAGGGATEQMRIVYRVN